MSNYSLVRVFVIIACLINTAAYATLTAYDGFNYGPAGSDLQGNNGGFGFSSGWTAGGFNASIHNNYDIASGSLGFGSLLTSGNSVVTSPVTAISGLTRSLSSPLGAAGTTAYLSFLIEPRGVLNDGVFNGFFGVVFESATEPEVFAGKPGAGTLNEYVIEDRGGAGQFPSGVSTVINQTALLVIKAEFGLLSDTFTMYVNPTPGGAEPLSGTVKIGNIDTIVGLTLYSTGGHAIDELRLGETFADVTPTSRNVPETGPGMFGFAAVLGLLIIGRQVIRKSCRNVAG
jgi:hypothetical protein